MMAAHAASAQRRGFGRTLGWRASARTRFVQSFFARSPARMPMRHFHETPETHDMPRPNEFVLTLFCHDTKGVVFAVSGLLYQAGCNIVDSQQFGDIERSDQSGGTGLFFMRVHFEAPPHLATPADL